MSFINMGECDTRTLVKIDIGIIRFALTMQKFWFSKSKRSLPPEDEPTSSPESAEEIFQEVAKPIKKLFEWEVAASWVFLALAVGGVIIVATLGLRYLTAPDATPDSNLACKSKISGDWQTPFGKLTLQEKQDNLVSGKYEYTNFERGKIVGKLTGKVSNNVINFDWQETLQQQPQQQGKGILVFGEGCKEFYGSYGTGDNTNNFGNWQGLRLSK